MLRWPVGLRETLRVSVHLSLFHAGHLVRVLTRSPGSGAAKSRGIRAKGRSQGYQYAGQSTHTTPATRQLPSCPVSLSLFPSYHPRYPPSAGSFLFLSVSLCVYPAVGPGADVSINSGTRRPSRLISIHSRHTYSMCHEIIER